MSASRSVVTQATTIQLQRLSLALTTMIAVVSVSWFSSSSAQEEPLICNPGTTVQIAGTGPANAGLLLSFGERAVGGGVSDAAGSYRLALQVGNERPGEYSVAVEVRSSRELLYRRSCTVPGALATNTPVAPGGTPRPAATPRPGATATALATATPTLPPISSQSCADIPTTATSNYPIKIVGLDKDAETVTLRNVSVDQTISLNGWRLCSVLGDQEQRGIGGTLAPQSEVEFLNPSADGEIWRNDLRDDAALYDAEGRLISYLIDQ